MTAAKATVYNATGTIPSQFDSSKIGTLYNPNIAAFTQEGHKASYAPASTDRKRVAVLFIDAQTGFIHPDGGLPVTGAVADTDRGVRWCYRNAAHITGTLASLDTHVPIQISHGEWWRNRDTKEHPAPFTVVTKKDLDAGVWEPLFDVKWSLQYVNELERTGNKALMIWPPHCRQGTPDHALVPALAEFLTFHAAARLVQPYFLQKGAIPQVEHYGIIEPEVHYPNHPLGGVNTAFLEALARYDEIWVVASQAETHCVVESMKQMVRYFATTQPDVIRRVRFMTDTTSPVLHPDIDFHALAMAEYDQMAKQGVVMVTSNDDITA